MKQKLIVAALAAMSSLAANAGTVLIDDFSAPAVGAYGVTSAAPTSTDYGRTLEISNITGETIFNTAVASVQGGLFSVSNGSGVDSTVTLSWNVAAGLVPSGSSDLSFLFTVVQSDGNPTNLDFSFEGSPLAAFAIPGGTNGADLTFGIADGALDGGGTLSLVINGATGWDLTLDAFGLAYTDPDVTPPLNPIPEPATLALVGLGLLGAGALRRRR
ncbi:PEP-CTERM sorting domain-containing protein [Cognatazoarcus halotolerans]|uniref:PEP-CTERM sorting domain-containing protein n=1 Tax=Cognatazoarcus halotolerans TaxID=2686016 RepID=UPI0013593F71|nr:PEP-CTERM sorting domain-containing protein [Cognatazoarcus halotolerans]MCB1900706.1 PEP-CTERM sorting domain-containing protein [Rhodocyclaceae bacterium]MCP5307889.1 PEP-CTERM sorting domain-containing protein [Zoogloeaceae bacterium]